MFGTFSSCDMYPFRCNSVTISVLLRTWHGSRSTPHSDLSHMGILQGLQGSTMKSRE